MGGAPQVAMRVTLQIWQIIFASQTLQVFCFCFANPLGFSFGPSQKGIIYNSATSWLVRNWNIFGARTSHGQTWTHKTHHDLDLGEATTFPFIMFFMLGHRASTQMSFCPRTSSGSPEILKIRTPMTLTAHDFVCKPLIEVKSKTKLEPSSKPFQWYVKRHLNARKLGRFLTFNGRESNWQFDSRPFFWP